MIRNRNNLKTNIANIITEKIAQINEMYRGGPSWHFYHRIFELRRKYKSVKSFLLNEECIEILYATLVSWDMNSRGAKMKDYADFKDSLQSNSSTFQVIENAAEDFSWKNCNAVVKSLTDIFDKLSLMKTDSKLVSNSKCLHFVFPDLCPPMDGTNTLKKIYGNTGESIHKFREILELTYDIIGGISNPKQYLDNQWNLSETKLVDNAIIMM